MAMPLLAEVRIAALGRLLGLLRDVNSPLPIRIRAAESILVLDSKRAQQPAQDIYNAALIELQKVMTNPTTPPAHVVEAARIILDYQ